MTSNLEAHLASCGVDPTFANQLVCDGWSMEAFSMLVNDRAEFTDEVWEQLMPGTSLSLLQKSSLKHAWQQLQDAPRPGPSSGDPSNSSSSPSVESSWSEAFAPKLSPNAVAALKKQYLQDYPGEVLSHETLPSSRLLALAHLQHQRSEHKWIPWK